MGLWEQKNCKKKNTILPTFIELANLQNYQVNQNKTITNKQTRRERERGVVCIIIPKIVDRKSFVAFLEEEEEDEASWLAGS